MRILIALILTIGAAYAQSTVRGEQVRVVDPATNTVLPYSVVVLNPNGTLQVALLGPGLTLDRSTTPPTLRVSVASTPAAVEEIVGEVLTAAKGLPYPLSRLAVAGSIKVYINGVRQEPSSYTVGVSTGTSPTTTIKFIEYFDGWVFRSTVVVDYRVQ